MSEATISTAPISATVSAGTVAAAVSSSSVAATIGGTVAGVETVNGVGGAVTLAAVGGTWSTSGTTLTLTVSGGGGASDWNSITGKPSTFAPSAHASSHAAAGADPISITAAQVTDFAAAAAAAVSGTRTLQRFTARDNQPPASNFATLDTRNSVLVLEFDAATEESAVFVGVINEAATLTSGLVVRIWWMADTATSGDVRWGVQFERTGTDLDADSYDTAAQVTSTASGTSGIESVAQITITTVDSLAAGDRFRLRVYRVAADATNDTMLGDAQLTAVEVRAA